MDSATIPPEAADWIAAVVLTKTYTESAGGLALERMCACQYGPCGYCGMGRHDKCTHREQVPAGGPDTYIQNRRGGCVASVSRSGKPCQWRCPCDCPVPVPVPVVVEPAPIEQLELFSLVGGVR